MLSISVMVKSVESSPLTQQRRGRIAKLLFESIRKMREVLKAHFVAYLYGLLFLFYKLVMRQFQSFFRKPSLRRGMECLPEVALKRCEATTGEVPKLLQRQIEHEVLFHIGGQINFAGLLEIRQHIVNAFVNASEDADGLCYFQ